MTHTIRPATLAEMDLLIDWAAAEGWNPGLRDAATFHAADPEGFLIGLREGRPVACISGVRTGSVRRTPRLVVKVTVLFAVSTAFTVTVSRTVATIAPAGRSPAAIG